MTDLALDAMNKFQMTNQGKPGDRRNLNGVARQWIGKLDYFIQVDR